MLHPKDIVIATHDITGSAGSNVRKGTRGMVLKHWGSDQPTYRVEFSFGKYPRSIAVLDELTDSDLRKVEIPSRSRPVR